MKVRQKIWKHVARRVGEGCGGVSGRGFTVGAFRGWRDILFSAVRSFTALSFSVLLYGVRLDAACSWVRRVFEVRQLILYRQLLFRLVKMKRRKVIFGGWGGGTAACTGNILCISFASYLPRAAINRTDLPVRRTTDRLFFVILFVWCRSCVYWSFVADVL